MTGEAAVATHSGLRRASWLVLALVLGGLGVLEALGVTALWALGKDLERGAGRVEPVEIEELRRRNEELGRDPKQSADRFRADLLRASLRSLPWNEYLRRPALRRLRGLLVVSALCALLSGLAALAVAAGRDRARRAVLLTSLLQLAALGLAALILVRITSAYAVDFFTDLRLRQDDVARAIGTQAPLQEIGPPETMAVRALALGFFLLFGLPWQLAVLASPLSTVKKRGPEVDASGDRGHDRADGIDEEFVEPLAVPEEDVGS